MPRTSKTPKLCEVSPNQLKILDINYEISGTDHNAYLMKVLHVPCGRIFHIDNVAWTRRRCVCEGGRPGINKTTHRMALKKAEL